MIDQVTWVAHYLVNLLMITSMLNKQAIIRGVSGWSTVRAGLTLVTVLESDKH